MKSESEIRAEWLSLLVSTAAADRPRAETALRTLYDAARFAPPQHVIWFNSPCEASWPVAALVAPYHQVWGARMKSAETSRVDRARIEGARSAMREQLNARDWNDVLSIVGRPLGMHLQFPPDPTRLLQSKILEARFSLSSSVSQMFTARSDADDLYRAESRFWGSNKGALRSALHCPTTDSLIGYSFFEDYSFSTMADDQLRVGDREPPAIMQAAWDVARSSGMWWPFENAAIATERPEELHLDEEMLLHDGDRPAAVFRDGWRVYAWHGVAVPEDWILHPERIPAGELKHFDASFRKHVAARTGASSPKPRKQKKQSVVLRASLRADPGARLDELRAHARGHLPLFDRYQAGDHRNVWNELIALGTDVRQDPYAADALAVAYEVMRRVDSNVRTLAQRLRNAGYVMGQAHVPPAPDVRKTIADFERAFGALPLSLRAFYEVVGEVNFIGHHPTIAPSDGSVAVDPLVVFGLDAAMADLEESDNGQPFLVTIAPDDLHKADTSGGDPYSMAIPDLRADGELLNERHRLFFVDYLRLCFRFGGFPGYDGVTDAPKELDDLMVGLIQF